MAAVSVIFARRLRALCKERQLSQADIAREMDVTRGSVGHWRTGFRMPHSSRIPKLAAFLGVTVGHLYGEGPSR
jgi:transcriptional regulator with XRE-family HTH domain